MPLLSVVIPTRNRYTYLVDSVNIALESLNDVEVIVCDNSDDDRLRSALAGAIDDSRLKYCFVRESLSVVANFEHALRMSTGEYVVFIGDDDSVGPGLEEIANWAKAEDVDAVVSYRHAFLVSYFWPGVKSKYFGDAYSAQIFIHKFSGRSYVVNPIEALKKIANKLGGGLGDIPRAYHGLVSRSLIERILTRYGHLFGGVSPDIYSATLISANCKNPRIVDYPFIIPGASPTSTAGQGAEQSDRGSLHSTEHINRFGSELKWDNRIPKFYSPYTVWAYSFCKALELVPEIQVKPDYGRLYACCLLYCRPYWRLIYAAMATLAREEGWCSVGLQTFAGLISEVGSQMMRISLRLKHLKAGGGAQRYGSVQTIGAAFKVLNNHIVRRNISLHLDKAR